MPYGAPFLSVSSLRPDPVKHALSVTREQDFSAWYQAVITEADLAEESGVRGCMVI
ncbi:MAG: proline--tRNA ligase, partial [Alphaproteobacteria bacterium]